MARPARLTVILLAVLTVAALLAAGTVGWLARGGPDHTSGSSVDAGFARDMATHHTQAVIMAGYARDHSTDPAISNLAYDIETSQNAQVGQMTGWLDGWGLTRTSSEPVKGWMGGEPHDMDGMDMSSASAGASADPVTTSLRPGMATPDEMDKLERMSGKALDVYFLQLMLRHHNGGVAMAQYAADHASHEYVRGLAGAMVANRDAEIITMRSMLAARGASEQ